MSWKFNDLALRREIFECLVYKTQKEPCLCQKQGSSRYALKDVVFSNASKIEKVPRGIQGEKSSKDTFFPVKFLARFSPFFTLRVKTSPNEK